MVKSLWLRPGLKGSIAKAGMFILLLALTNLIFDRYFYRIDFTQEKKFTLSPSSIQILKGLTSPVTIAVYLEGSLPAPFKRLQKETRELLDECKAYSHGFLRVSFTDPHGGRPETNRKATDSLSKYGLEGTSLHSTSKEVNSETTIYPGALVEAGSRTIAINLLQNQNQLAGSANTDQLINNAVEVLEYKFIRAIRQIVETKPALVGLLSGNGEPFGPGIADLVKTLQHNYRVGKVDLNRFPLDSMVKISVIIMVKPILRFTEVEKYKLDQFVMHGGKLLIMIDLVDASLDSMGSRASTLGLARSLNLDDFFFRFGLRINYNLLKDLNCAPIPVITQPEKGSDGQRLEPWVYFPLVMPVGVHPLIRNLDPVRLTFASTIDTLGIKGIHKTFLLASSPYTQVASTPVVIELSQLADPAEHANLYTDGLKNVAVLVEGVFHSNFQHRTMDGLDKSLAFKPVSLPTAMIVVSDGDLALNQVNPLDHSIYPLGYDKYTQQVFGNKTFIENSVDYLTDKQDLISLRSKQVAMRLLDRALVDKSLAYWQALGFGVPIGILLMIILCFSAYRYFYYRA